MSADYNGTDKSKCSRRCWASWASFGKQRWPGRTVPGLCQSQVPLSPRERPGAVLPQACPALGSAPPDAGCCFYLLLNDWSPCCGIPWEMLNIPAWNVWKGLVGDFLRSLKSREKQELVFSTDVLFSISNFFSFVWRTTWEHTVELGDFSCLL